LPVVCELFSKKVYVDSTSVIPESYCRMPLSLHWRWLTPALVFDGPPRYADVVRFYAGFDVKKAEELLVDLLSQVKSLSDLYPASLILFAASEQ